MSFRHFENRRVRKIEIRFKSDVRYKKRWVLGLNLERHQNFEGT